MSVAHAIQMTDAPNEGYDSSDMEHYLELEGRN